LLDITKRKNYYVHPFPVGLRKRIKGELQTGLGGKIQEVFGEGKKKTTVFPKKGNLKKES